MDGEFVTPYQYTEAELRAAVGEAARLTATLPGARPGVPAPGHGVAVHATGEPGTGYAVAAGVASVDHAYQLSEETMAAMKAKGIPAVPTFAISEYFMETAGTPERKARERKLQEYHVTQFKRQMAAGVPFAVGSDVGRFRMDAGAGDGVDGRVRDAGGGGAAGGSVEWGEAAGVGGADGRVEGGVFGGRGGGGWGSGGGHRGDDAGTVCDEGWGGVSAALGQVSCKDKQR